MRPSQRPLATLVLLGLVSATACSGGGSSTPVAPIHPANPNNPVTSTGTSSGFAYDANFVRKAQLLGPASFGHLGIDVALPMRDARGLVAFAQAVSDPKSASYRHFLTPDQIADRYGATLAQQTAAIAYFHGFNIWASGWKQRMLLHVAGTQPQLEAAFHTKFGSYRSPTGEAFIAPMSAPSVGAGVPVVGSANIVFRAKRFNRQFVSSKGPGTGYSPQQIAAAFDYTGAYNAGYTGTGITIAVVGTGPIQTTTTSPARLGDADAYKQLYNVGGSSTVNIVATTGSDPVINANSGFASPPPVTAPCNTSGAPGFDPSDSPSLGPPLCNPEDGEAQLDTEQTAELAKDATVEFYLAFNPNDGCGAAIGTACAPGTGFPAQGLLETDEELQTIIDHNTADVVSMSFGGAEFAQAGPPGESPPFEFTSDGSGLDPTEFAMMVTLGMSLFVSSGDVGAEGCSQFPSLNMSDSLCVEYPASDPSVVGVGGVTAPINAAGQIAGPVTAWGVQTSGGTSGSGGGVSAFFPLPSYQTGAVGIIGSNRNVPDAALDGDPATGVAALLYADPSFGGAELFDIGGTSVAAPEMAAMWALVVQACKQNATCSTKGGGTHPYRLGNPDPVLYNIYHTASTYNSTFLSVLYGNNSLLPICQQEGNCPSPAPGATPTPGLDPGFNANPNGGYNQITGLGVPFGRALIKAVVGV